jgi:hypothetical protein
MPIWNTQQVTSDLLNIVGVNSISSSEGISYTTASLILHLAGTGGQDLFVTGYKGIVDLDNPSDIEVSMIELRDNYYRGGLNSHDFRVARAYIDVRQYFINRGFDVIQSIEDHQ